MNPKSNLTALDGYDTTTFILYLILSARQRFHPPHLLFNPALQLAPHDEPDQSKSIAGEVFLYSNLDYRALFIPVRNRTLKILSSLDSNHAMAVSRMAGNLAFGTPQTVRSDLPPGFVVVSQTVPHAAVFAQALNCPIYPYGAWTSDIEALVLTNLENFDKLAPTIPEGTVTWRTYRMREIVNTSINMGTENVRRRWTRWRTQSHILSSPAARFQALEHSIL